MEFFNKKQDVIDIKLTQFGRYKLSNGKFNPKYYAFFENGDVAATGQFSFDKPVGTWTEFYKSGKKKREIKHTKSEINLNESFIMSSAST